MLFTESPVLNQQAGVNESLSCNWYVSPATDGIRRATPLLTSASALQ